MSGNGEQHSFQVLPVEIRETIASVVDEWAYWAISEIQKVPPLERGDWVNAQMKAGLNRLSQTIKTDREVIAFHMGMRLGMYLEAQE